MAYKEISISIDERTHAEANEAVEKILPERCTEKSGNPIESPA